MYQTYCPWPLLISWEDWYEHTHVNILDYKLFEGSTLTYRVIGFGQGWTECLFIKHPWPCPWIIYLTHAWATSTSLNDYHNVCLLKHMRHYEQKVTSLTNTVGGGGGKQKKTKKTIIKEFATCLHIYLLSMFFVFFWIYVVCNYRRRSNLHTFIMVASYVQCAKCSRWK